MSSCSLSCLLFVIWLSLCLRMIASTSFFFRSAAIFSSSCASATLADSESCQPVSRDLERSPSISKGPQWLSISSLFMTSLPRGRSWFCPLPSCLLFSLAAAARLGSPGPRTSAPSSFPNCDNLFAILFSLTTFLSTSAAYNRVRRPMVPS